MKKKDMIDALVLIIGIFLLIAALLIAAPAGAAEYGPYQVQVVDVIDGDTLKVDVELWPGLTQRVSVRVAGVNAPELRSGAPCEREAGRNAKAFVQGRIMNAEEVIITDIQHDKFAGRVIAHVLIDGNDLGVMLLATGHAREYDGGARSAWCK